MKVLIAEDDPVSRRLLQSHLEKWGHEVTAAADGADAWRSFEAGEFPLVLSDWMMPQMDGLELIQRIRAAERPGYVYCILLTARSQKTDVVRGMEAGADDFVTKPFDRDELRARLRAGERILALEQTLARQKVVLMQSEKLASLGQLAAGIAHEINNPIAYVSNNLAVLRRDVLAALGVLEKYQSGRAALAQVEPALAAETARLEEAMDLAYLQSNLGRLFDKSLQGLQRVRDIVRNLRDFARLDEADFQEVNLNTALTATLEILHHEITRHGVQIENDLQPLPLVPCHSGKLNQVFLNLLLNAVQACETGGTVRVSTRAIPEEAVEVAIADTGCGIRPEHLPRLFEPFFTTKPVGQGMGLGLSVSYGIVRDHGGTIQVESTPGQGSTFRVRLPLRRP